MEISEIAQIVITVLTSGAVLMVLRQQIKSQQDQIAHLKSTMEAMKGYMDIVKVDEIKKYVELKEDAAVVKGQLAAEKVLLDTINNKEWARDLFKPLEEKFDKKFDEIFEKDLFQKGQELFNNLIEQLSCLPKVEAFQFVESNYPLNKVAILEELEDLENDIPDYFKSNRESFLENLPEHLKTEKERGTKGK